MSQFMLFAQEILIPTGPPVSGWMLQSERIVEVVVGVLVATVVWNVLAMLFAKIGEE